MAFLDQISKNLAGYGKEAAKKAKDTAEIFQLKAEIRGENRRSMSCMQLLVLCILKITETSLRMSTKCSSLRSKTQWSTLQNWKKS